MKDERDASLRFATSRGEEFEGHLVQLGRYEAVFDLYAPEDSLRTSEVLPRLSLKLRDRTLYEGKATVASLVNSGSRLTCRALLDERGVNTSSLTENGTLSFEYFQKQWLAGYRILPEFKIVVADVTILLSQVSRWMDYVQLTLRAEKNGDAAAAEQKFVTDLAPRVIKSFNSLHERFEELAYRVDPDLKEAHRNFTWRQWSPFFLCTPFGYRTFYKPLGYAGDYEMMNQIHRNAPEGDTLFAKAMHMLLVSQWPAESVRLRIAHLKQTLVNEIARVARSGRRARILNVGCGPAREVQYLLREHGTLANHADFTFMDFNDETLKHAGEQFESLRRLHAPSAALETRLMSVHHLLRSAVKDPAKQKVSAQPFDFVYCAGLFDYLSDATCKALVNVFYHMLNPRGLVVVANMNDSKPFRNFIEFVLDWHLIYRDSSKMWRFVPDDPAAENAVIAEPTTVNLFLETRRPA
jgi:extracellular factor (EF) 3-hydroxypalmitic acid methyl ester biosynthesis protein